MYITSYWLAVIFYVLFQNIFGLFYTSIIDMKRLVYTQKAVYNTLKKYRDIRDLNLGPLCRYIDLIRTDIESSMEDPEGYVANPINALILVKHLTVDWKIISDVANRSSHLPELIDDVNLLEQLEEFPSSKDWEGTIDAFILLQDIYELETGLLARGYLNDVKCNASLNALACFEIAKHCFNKDDYYHAQLWFKEAELQVVQEVTATIEKRHIFEYLLALAVIEGDLLLQTHYGSELLAIGSNFPNKLRSTIDNIKGQQNPSTSKAWYDKVNRSEFLQINSIKASYQLCRGEIPAPLTSLKCHYTNNQNPFLLLAPFKLEEISSDPQIKIFHDVISDREIHTIQLLAEAKYRTGNYIDAHWYKVAKTIWLYDTAHKSLQGLSIRVADMTKLFVEPTEPLQVTNYGIGGSHEYHFDHALKNEAIPFGGAGNRIATTIFYMSAVAQGGATIFPRLNITVWPEKGAMVLWYNLHSSGDGNGNTVHCGCPVLLGSKWIGNKFIHTLGQELLHPCGLSRPPEHLIS